PTKTGTSTATPTVTQTATKTIPPTATITRTATLTATPIPNLVLIGPGGSTSFVPSTITISAGQTVTWQWVDPNVFHSTTSGTCSTPPPVCVPGPVGNPLLQWDSGSREQGGPLGDFFAQTFPNPGIYTYFCINHLFMMQGTVIVNP